MLKKLSQKKDVANKAEYKLTKFLEENIAYFESLFEGDKTFITRRFQNKYLPAAKCCILYFEGMVNSDILNKNIIQPILGSDLSDYIRSTNLLDELHYKVIEANNVKKTAELNEIITSVIYGDTVFLVEGYAEVLLIHSKGWKSRSISEPESDKIVRGPREGFTEAIIVNITLLRRKIMIPDFKLKFKEIGTRSKSKICICYVAGIARDDILAELEKRLDAIDIDAILDSGYIQELIRDAPFSPFETVGASERPDVVASKLLEGRIAIIVDGSPFVLTVPYLLVEGSQASEDYYNNFLFGSINRFIRATSALITIGTPAIFLALTTFHQEMLPTPLLLSISASREGVPFPTVLSLFIMLLIFDILREAGTRMPVNIGQAISIVGSLVLGQAAVEAKLVSAPVIIITAFSGITTLLNKDMITSVIILRFFLLFLASVMGIYGYIFGMIVVLLHLMNIRSFGVPYMLSLSTAFEHKGQDSWIRAPWWSMTLRPRIIAAKNLVRQARYTGRR